MGRVWETAERRDLATSLALRDGRGVGRTRTRARPSRLRAIVGRKHCDETTPSGGEIAEKRLQGAECAGIGMLPAEDPHAGKALAAEGYRWAQASRRDEV